MIFLTGDLTRFDERKFNYLHHYAIDITSRNWDELHAVLHEPEELRRQRIHRPAHPYGQPGDLVLFDESCARVRHVLEKFEEADENTQVSEAERMTLFTNLPTRGYIVEAPSFETLDHTTLSGAVYHAAFTKLVKTGVDDFETTSKLIRALSATIDQIAD